MHNLFTELGIVSGTSVIEWLRCPVLSDPEGDHDQLSFPLRCVLSFSIYRSSTLREKFLIFPCKASDTTIFVTVSRECFYYRTEILKICIIFIFKVVRSGSRVSQGTSFTTYKTRRKFQAELLSKSYDLWF